MSCKNSESSTKDLYESSERRLASEVFVFSKGACIVRQSAPRAHWTFGARNYLAKLYSKSFVSTSWMLSLILDCLCIFDIGDGGDMDLPFGLIWVVWKLLKG